MSRESDAILQKVLRCARRGDYAWLDYAITDKMQGDNIPKDERLERLIHELDEFKRLYPYQKVIVDAPNNGSDFRFGDANIYVDPHGALVFDAE